MGKNPFFHSGDGCRHFRILPGLEYCYACSGLIFWPAQVGLPDSLIPKDGEAARDAARGAIAACRASGFHGPIEAVLVCCPEERNPRKGIIYLCDGDS